MSRIIRPPRLEPGDQVRVVAASGPVDRERFAAGLEALEGRYDLCFEAADLYAREGFLAGSDKQRLQALNAAIADSECRAVFLARGGYGLLRILAQVNGKALLEHPKPIVGFSDVTALLAVCARTGVAAIHGPMISQFAGLPVEDRESLFRLLEDPAPGVLLSGLEAAVPGVARGPLLGGNLEVLSRLLGTPLQPQLDGAVLFLEEVGELPYRVDRLLTHFELAGVLSRVSGVVLGDFTDCDEVEDEIVRHPTTREILVERLARLAVPVVLGGTFGHGERNTALPYGTEVHLDATNGTLVALEGAVS
jgi:muramoyltetrapeptide carboxypeptidase